MRARAERSAGALRRGLVRPLFQAFFCLLLYLSGGCGYHPGIPGGGLGPEAGPAVAVPLFENATFEPILEMRLNEIFKETLLSKGWRLLDDPHRAALVLRGRIHRFERTPVSLNLQEQAQEYRIRIGMELMLVDSKGGPERAGKDAARKREVEGAADYIARADAPADRVARDRAIREAGRRMAEQAADFLFQRTSGAPPPPAQAGPDRHR